MIGITWVCLVFGGITINSVITVFCSTSYLELSDREKCKKILISYFRYCTIVKSFRSDTLKTFYYMLAYPLAITLLTIIFHRDLRLIFDFELN